MFSRYFCAATRQKWVFVSTIMTATLLLAGCSGGGGGGGGGEGGNATVTDDLTAYLEVNSANLSRIIADPVRPYVYLSDRARNEVHFFNTNSLSIDKSIAVGSMPNMMDIKADGSLLFIALSGASDIAVIDLNTKTLLSPIGVPGTPNALAVGTNDRLYVSVTNSSPISIYDISSLPATNVGTISKGAWGIVISGVTADKTKLFTHDQSTALLLTQWDISSGTPTEIQSSDVYSGPPVISSSPDSTSFVFVGNFSYQPYDAGAGFPLYNGDVPIFKTADLLPRGTVSMEWDPVAVGICPVTGTILGAHGDMVSNPTTPSVDLRHKQDKSLLHPNDGKLYPKGDLHAFNGYTFVETNRYALRDPVKEYGIACGPDGHIYLILGTSGIGVIVP